MELIINNRIIYTPIIDILKELQLENKHGFLSIIEDKNEYIRITCPFHKEGHEKNPSCSVYASHENTNIPPGTVHCFTCGAKTKLTGLVAYVLGISEALAEDWLIDKFSDTIIEYKETLDLSIFSRAEHQYLDENILNNYNIYHPYMTKRKLTPEVINTFKVGYNKDTKSITFPVWDEHGRLVMITERSVNSKRFFIPASKNKPVYLLNYIIQNNITEVTVTESQINALTLWGWGIPAIGLLGTGSNYQYEILKKSGIKKYHLALDGDEAGRKGINRFLQNMPDDIDIDIINLPEGKDINDLSFDEYKSLKTSLQSIFNML